MRSDITIEVTYGSCIDLDIEFLDVDENPEDISFDEFRILSSSDPLFKNVVFTIRDDFAGSLHFYLAAEHARKLRFGRGNWFRLARVLSGGCENTSPKITVHVK